MALELVRMLAANFASDDADALFLGPHMDDELYFICGPLFIQQWRRLRRLDDGCTEWLQDQLRASGVLASSNRLAAIFLLPEQGILQVRRVEQRIVCTASQCRDRTLTTDLLLRVIGPLVRARREAAQAGTVHPDNVLDAELRLDPLRDGDDDDESHFLPRRGSDMGANPQHRRAVFASMRQVASSLRSALVPALVDYARYLVDGSGGPHAPRDNLESVVVYGEIARNAGHLQFVPGAGGLARPVRLVLGDRESPESIRAVLLSPPPGTLVLCPLAGEGHWTLLYVEPRAPAPMLFDSLAPSRLATSLHAARVRHILPATPVEVFPLPANQRQTRQDCGIHVIAMAVSLMRGGMRGAPLPARQYAASVQRAMEVLWTTDVLGDYLGEMIYHMTVYMGDTATTTPPPRLLT